MAATLAEKVDDRIEAGDVSPIERTRATLARTSAENAHRIALQKVAARRDRLSGFWGSGEATLERAEGDLLSVSPPPPLDSLTARLAASPALARWTAIAAQRWQAVRLEQARRIPDVTLMGGIRRFSDLDGNTFIFGASLALPLFDRNGGAIEEAEARVAESLERQRAAATAVTRGLREGHRTLDNAYRVILMSRDTLVPGAEEALEAVGDGYRLGKFSYLDVLDVQRTLNEARAGYLRALADFHISVAELERLLGAPLRQSPTLDPSTSQE
jgi:cobalt-zinc-cadmium efflux system outer membrane protein